MCTTVKEPFQGRVCSLPHLNGSLPLCRGLLFQTAAEGLEGNEVKYSVCRPRTKRQEKLLPIIIETDSGSDQQALLSNQQAD